MGAGNAGTGGTGDSKTKTKAKSEKDTFVSGVESVYSGAKTFSSQKTSTQKDKERSEANVEVGLGTPSKNVTDRTLSDPREKDDTAAKQSIKDSKKTTTTYGGGNGGGGNNNTITQVTQTAPTIAEVDQVTTDTTPTETAETTEANRLLKIKKKGRSRSIMTSAKGVTKTSSDYSLGKPSLLGRV